MASKIAQDTDRLYRDIQEMRQEADRYREAAAQIYAAVQTLDASWEGPANETFKAAFLSDYRFCMELYKNISGILSSFEEAAGEYDRCEQDVAELIRQIRV